MGGSKRKQLSNRIYNNKKAKFRGNRYTQIPSSETKTLSFVEYATHSLLLQKNLILLIEIFKIFKVQILTLL